MNPINRIEQEAQAWSVKLSSGEADQAMLDDFNRWRTQDPMHERIFQEVDRIWLSMSQLQHMRGFAKVDVRQEKASWLQSIMADLSEWFSAKPLQIAGYACALFVASFITSQLWQADITPGAQAVVYETARANVQDYRLDDGSVITLAPLSRVRVTYSDSIRQVELLRGKGYFKVEKAANRPFFVRSGQVETRVVGTEFTVNRRTADVEVLVKEGKVQVSSLQSANTEKASAAKMLVAGNKVIAKINGKVGKVESVNVEHVGAWKAGKLIFENATLQTVIADANRYYKGKIIIPSTATAQKRVSIVFDSNNIEQMLAELSEVMDLEIEKANNGMVYINSR